MGGFTFKQFHVDHDLCAMKVGTDGTLLGAWAADGEDYAHILDVGCGSGLISLIMAQRCSNALVTAIDIDEGAVSQTRINADHSPWAARITTLKVRMQDHTPAAPYDHIVCNPPFFSHSLKCPDEQRTAARHADSLSLNDLLFHARRMLTPEGLISVIIPADLKGDADTASSLAGMYCIRQTWIKTTPFKQPKRVLMAFSPSYRPCNQDNTPETIIVGDDHYHIITDDLYL